MDWIITAHLRKMTRIEGQAMFESVESKVSFARCIRQGSVEAPRLWQKMVMQLVAKVEEEWTVKILGVILRSGRAQKLTQICMFHVGRQLAGSCLIAKAHLEQMLKDLVSAGTKMGFGAEARMLVVDERLYSRGEKDLLIEIEIGRHGMPFEDFFF